MHSRKWFKNTLAIHSFVQTKALWFFHITLNICWLNTVMFAIFKGIICRISFLCVCICGYIIANDSISFLVLLDFWVPTIKITHERWPWVIKYFLSISHSKESVTHSNDPWPKTFLYIRVKASLIIQFSELEFEWLANKWFCGCSIAIKATPHDLRHSLQRDFP